MAKTLRNTIRRKNGRRTAKIVCIAVIALAAATGVWLGYAKLREMWLDQFYLEEIGAQIHVSGGKMVKPDVLVSALGLKRGVNLATVDFAAHRERMLSRYPVIKDLSITFRYPKDIDISVIEREPAVRIGIAGSRKQTGYVADGDGMVFSCRRNTGLLPVIKEDAGYGTTPGSRLGGRSLAALRLLETSAQPEFRDLQILVADVTRPDYILLTLANYSTVKIAWNGMDEPTPSNHANLVRQLDYLVKCLRTGYGSGTDRAVIWNATDTSGRISVDTREIIP